MGRCQRVAAPREPERRLYVGHVQTFATLAELRKASTAIVKAKAGEQRLGEISGIPTTITKLAVTKVIWGKVAGSDVELRQLGVAGQLGNASRVLESGAEYLVFLVPSAGADDAAPNRYLIAGDVGLYELQGEQYVLRGGDLPPEGRNRLPVAEFTVAAIVLAGIAHEGHRDEPEGGGSRPVHYSLLTVAVPSGDHDCDAVGLKSLPYRRRVARHLEVLDVGRDDHSLGFLHHDCQQIVEGLRRRLDLLARLQRTRRFNQGFEPEQTVRRARGRLCTPGAC